MVCNLPRQRTTPPGLLTPACVGNYRYIQKGRSRKAESRFAHCTHFSNGELSRIEEEMFQCSVTPDGHVPAFHVEDMFSKHTKQSYIARPTTSVLRSGQTDVDEIGLRLPHLGETFLHRSSSVDTLNDTLLQGSDRARSVPDGNIPLARPLNAAICAGW